MLIKLFPLFFAWFGGTATADPPVMKPAPVLRAQPAEKAPAQPTAGAIRIAPNAADAVVKGVQNFYKSTNQLTAKFRQSNYNKTFGMPTVNDGKVYLKKPGKMRWDYFSKRNKTEVTRSQMSDGKTIWRARFGLFAEQEARDVCNLLTQRGQTCFAAAQTR